MLFAFLVLTASLTSFLNRKTIAQTSAKVSVSAPTKAKIGDQIIATVSINGINDLYGFQIDIRYDQSSLDFLSWSKGDFIRNLEDQNDPFWVEPDFSNGLIEKVAVTKITPDLPVSGSGELFRLIFQAKEEVIPEINLENAIFLNKDNKELPTRLVSSSGTISVPTIETDNSEPAICFGENDTIGVDDLFKWFIGLFTEGPDVNGDGKTNSFEFSYLISNWRRECQN